MTTQTNLALQALSTLRQKGRQHTSEIQQIIKITPLPDHKLSSHTQKSIKAKQAELDDFIKTLQSDAMQEMQRHERFQEDRQLHPQTNDIISWVSFLEQMVKRDFDMFYKESLRTLHRLGRERICRDVADKEVIGFGRSWAVLCDVLEGMRIEYKL